MEDDLGDKIDENDLLLDDVDLGGNMATELMGMLSDVIADDDDDWASDKDNFNDNFGSPLPNENNSYPVECIDNNSLNKETPRSQEESTGFPVETMDNNSANGRNSLVEELDNYIYSEQRDNAEYLNTHW